MNNNINKLYCGDNLQIMHGMADESVDLIYLDPPFFSGKKYEVIWGDKAEVRSFDDRFEGGIMVYVEWMKDRLIEMHRILKSTGSIYLHVDWHAVHYLKVEMDKIFGMSNFQDEIIWSYTKVGGTTKKYLKWHETILRYTKTGEFTFNMDEVREPYSKGTLKSLKEDEKGWFYTRGLGTDKSIKRIKKTYINKNGKIPGDVWNISQYAPPKSERLGYPTQKPEALLERIIKASSNKGDIVFDPFCGCGTTVAVAQKLERQYIGIDISPIACKLIAHSERVKYPIDEIVGLPRTAEEIGNMEPHEFQNWVCQKMSAKNTSPNVKTASGADGGVDGVIQSPLINPDYHKAPIQVKRSKGVGVNTVKNFFATMHDLKRNVGFIVALSFGSGAKEQVAIYRNEGSVVIHLLTVKDIVDAQDLSDITSKLK